MPLAHTPSTFYPVSLSHQVCSQDQDAAAELELSCDPFTAQLEKLLAGTVPAEYLRINIGCRLAARQEMQKRGRKRGDLRRRPRSTPTASIIP